MRTQVLVLETVKNAQETCPHDLMTFLSATLNGA